MLLLIFVIIKVLIIVSGIVFLLFKVFVLLRIAAVIVLSFMFVFVLDVAVLSFDVSIIFVKVDKNFIRINIFIVIFFMLIFESFAVFLFLFIV